MRFLSFNTILVLIGVLLIAAFLCLFTVTERETAIRFRFGEIVQFNYEPGLHWKLPPPFNNVTKFDRRIQSFDAPPERFLTAEKKNVIVDYFIQWKISDSRRFFTAVSGNINRANQRLDQIMKDGVRGEFGKRNITEVISGDREQIMDVLLTTAKDEAPLLGIDVIDVRIKRIDLPEEVSGSVFARMRAERERIAREFRSNGQKESERMRAEADRKRTVILAEAYRDSEIIRGEGDAISANTYANAFSKDAEFYRFSRSLKAYRNSFNTGEDILVLQPKDSDFFKFFNNLK